MANKTLDILLVAAAIALGGCITMMALHAAGAESFGRDTVLGAAGGIATILGAALGAAIAVNGSVKVARQQLDTERAHALEDREAAKRHRSGETLALLLPLYDQIHAYAPLSAVLKEKADRNRFQFQASQLAANLATALDFPLPLETGDTARPLVPGTLQQLRRLHDLVQKLQPELPLTEFMEIANSSRAAAMDAGERLRMLLTLALLTVRAAKLSKDEINTVLPPMTYAHRSPPAHNTGSRS